jgi:hypothetical protein
MHPDLYCAHSAVGFTSSGPDRATNSEDLLRFRRFGELLTVVQNASLPCARGPQSAILNLEEGHAVACWGRLIFHVADVDAFWTYLKGRGFDPENPRDAPLG